MSKIARTPGEKERAAYDLVGDLPGVISRSATMGWPLFVSFLMTVYGYLSLVFLTHAHILRIRRAAEIGAKPEDIKVDYEVS